MNLKQETLGWLAELPDESPRWRELHDEIALVRSLDAAGLKKHVEEKTAAAA